MPADDGPGRVVGSKCGIAAWELGVKYFDGSILAEPPRLAVTRLAGDEVRLDWTQRRGLFYKVLKTNDLQSFVDETPLERARDVRGSYTINSPVPARQFYQIEQGE